MIDIEDLLETTANRHSHLCPRQVLGVRIGLAGAAALGVQVPQNKKHMLSIIETDGCFADGVEVATGCTVGHRTLRMEDYGKIAATFIEISTGRAVRVAPQLNVRQKAFNYSPHQKRRYLAQLESYQIMSIDELVFIEEVTLTIPIETIISRAGARVNCGVCGEEIINEREIVRNDMPVCKSCAGASYYRVLQQPVPTMLWRSVQNQDVPA